MPAFSAELPQPQSLTPLELDFARQQAESGRHEQSASPRLDQKKPTARIVSPTSESQFTRPVHTRTGSSDSRASARSNSSRPSSSANRNTIASGHVPTGNPAPGTSSQNPAGANPDYRQVNVPPRSSSSDAANAKRTATPSPLSKPVTMDAAADKVNRPDVPNHGATPQQPAKPESPAVKQLAAINGKQPKSKTSRLRRAFSFGSAAELRKAAGGQDADVSDNTPSSGPARLHKNPTPEEMYDAEQERIAQQQEAAGLGTNIYSGGKMFMSSTDNISVSSTASSASIMIRKMGRGMKKGGRSLVGLFRPKSVIGVPPPDSRSSNEGSHTAVSMITVEAERERVNVNPDPTQPGGGTGFPRLERNSIDTSKASTLYDERPQSAGTHGSAGRKSIVGGERERAEVLAAVRKGILKRNGSATPPPKSDSPPRFTDSPAASLPGTPNDEAQGHRRTDSINIGNEDYFVSALRLRQDTKSAPGTPQGQNRRCATFSPRIIFHDTWPSGEYDRRGDIATCNRLTPMLAQQIKEELNTFKMEMEVHETSKIYTHFF
ncbi:bud neck involved protein [Coniochaeta pulveracea]|uniref:Bud neck involved protein n=1 Tax=Coniochaeta pulveracea TaxID=177199 RepID=A0A420Y4T4_9PEZI|nr:bud neck involved protein [Coniochaeta pulveracea]